ncbi:A-kinase-interacting protein 1 isoform X4 [Gallus gallus]|uniref:A-kinase-interacting protein 1 isoform X4 n=1 Tax=Gallus gallus TaxID=9031 RepID=UPI001AE2BF12|nr:A-kinase-interacting protein 1 isoform X4 [Gallus gallus]XP_040557277.1 A-kinase-interacting protein 1 isoform X4 [Gallus gallus]
MDGARAGRTAGLARAVLERARRRRERERAASAPEEDSERLSAAFASVMSFMAQATRECESYYSLVPACRRREHEVKHICRYHGRQAGGEEPEPSLDRFTTRCGDAVTAQSNGRCVHRPAVQMGSRTGRDWHS